MINDEKQLKSIILNNQKNNNFHVFIKFSFFRRFKIFDHSNVFFHIQYKMIQFFEIMIFKLFYEKKIINDFDINISNRSLFLKIKKYFKKYFRVDFFLMILNVKKKFHANNTSFFYNMKSANIIIIFVVRMIQKEIVKFIDILIMISYRAQYKFYRQIVRNLILIDFKTKHIQIQTMNFMQKCQTFIIFFDIVASQKFDFMKNKNRMNVACFRVMKTFIIIVNVDEIMKQFFFVRCHFENVFNHFKRLRVEQKYFFKRINNFLSTILLRGDMKNQIYDKSIDKNNANKTINHENVDINLIQKNTNEYANSNVFKIVHQKKNNIKFFIIDTTNSSVFKIVHQKKNNVNIFIIDETTTAKQIAKIVHQKKNNVNTFIIDEMTTT